MKFFITHLKILNSKTKLIYNLGLDINIYIYFQLSVVLNMAYFMKSFNYFFIKIIIYFIIDF